MPVAYWRDCFLSTELKRLASVNGSSTWQTCDPKLSDSSLQHPTVTQQKVSRPAGDLRPSKAAGLTDIRTFHLLSSERWQAGTGNSTVWKTARQLRVALNTLSAGNCTLRHSFQWNENSHSMKICMQAKSTNEREKHTQIGFQTLKPVL